ncbi:MAG: TerB family tellurite resistance protein [Polyangiaceae bacterium]|jgi:tellurite resistance protein
MLNLTRTKLDPLREALRERGARPSIVVPATPNAQELVEALRLVEEWGAFVEAMYLMMAADRRVKNVEREVLRGALLLLSEERVRTRHMEAMLDAAMRKMMVEGPEKRLAAVIEALQGNPAKAESAVVVAAAIAAADLRVVPEEHAFLAELARGLGIDEARAEKLLGEMAEEAVAQ